MATTTKPPQLYMLIDVTTVEATKILQVCPHHSAQLWGKIYQAQGKKVLAPPLLRRGFSVLERLPLQYLVWNTTNEKPSDDYGDNIARCLKVIESYPVDDTTAASLEREVSRLYPDGYTSVAQTANKQKAAPNEHAEPRKEGATKAVWQHASAVFAEMGVSFAEVDWKVFRPKLFAACQAAGINDGTTGVQYGKWKAAELAKK